MKFKNNKLSYLAIIMAGVILLSGCASTTLIQSVPENATLYINGEEIGVTPYQYTDDDIIFSSTDIKLEKEGYETTYGSFSRDEELDAGPVIGGFLLCPIFWLWAFKYQPVHTYEMPLLSDNFIDEGTPVEGSINDDKAEKLREIKSLLDEGILTPEEYNREKAKILEE